MVLHGLGRELEPHRNLGHGLVLLSAELKHFARVARKVRKPQAQGPGQVGGGQVVLGTVVGLAGQRAAVGQVALVGQLVLYQIDYPVLYRRAQIFG